MRIPHLLISSMLLLAQPLAAQPAVVTSIRPLQLIAAAVTNGISGPGLVLDGGQDPHHPSLKPSQRRLMDDADIFIWVGPLLETGMERAVAGLDARVITAMAIPGMTLLQAGDTQDPHVWLDSGNATTIAAALATQLEAMDPANAAGYAANLAAFRADMQAMAEAIRQQLGADTFPPYVVYHNGYQYFERQFGLSHQDSFTSNDEVQPGIRKVMAIRNRLQANDTACIVINPAVNAPNLANQLESATLKFVSIDVLANGFTPGEDSYHRFVLGLAQAFANCRNPG